MRLLLNIVGVAILTCAALWLNRADSAAPGMLGKIAGIDHVYASQQGVSPLIASTTEAPPKYALHILFLGNSFTFYHDIPRQLADIASSDPGNQTQFIVQSVTLAGKTLQQLWEEGKAAQLIQDGPSPGVHWDYVVLQEQSSWAMAEQFVHLAYIYTGNFNALIQQAGAKPLLELTWVNKPGSHLYVEYPYLRNPDYEYKRFSENTAILARKLGAEVVPVGGYWQLALAQEPAIELYESDGHHPNVTGSYLAALVFYKTLSGRDLTRVTLLPYGVKPEDAQKIRALVAQPLPATPGDATSAP